MAVKERTSSLTDHSSWHKGQNPTCFTYAQEVPLLMSNEELREYDVFLYVDRAYYELVRQEVQNWPFSDEPAATDHSSWHLKGQIPTCDTFALELYGLNRSLKDDYKGQIPTCDTFALELYGLYRSLKDDYKAIAAGRVYYDDGTSKMRSSKLSLIQYLTCGSASLRCSNAVEQMEEAEKALAQQTETVKTLKSMKENIMRELQVAEKQKIALERKLDASEHAVEELEDKFISAVDLSAILRKQRDDIQFELDTVMVERENIVREVKGLRKKNTLVTEEVKMQKDNLTKELEKAKKQILALRRQLAVSARIVKELEDKNDSTMELLTNSKKERDEIQLERDNALREAEELRQGREDVTTDLQMMKFFSVFSLMEIKQATQNFDPSLIIGRGGFGNVFKGNLRNTNVAIKRLHPNSSQGCSEFQKEVDVLSRVRHPNLVTLMGTCPEVLALIYEYLPNGSLEDRLAWEKNKTPPLSWQTRTRIAVEICSALIFLHSNKPHGIVHGDLKPANVLLDANFVSKLGDFGICRLVHFDGNTTGSTTPFCITTPKGTLGYMDPEFFSTGKLTPKSDVFAFGMVLLQLLTRRPAMRLVNKVQSALKKGGISEVLDASAGDWPLVQANELARLALRCCKMKRRKRPDLVSEVWSVLGQLKASCGDSSSSS